MQPATRNGDQHDYWRRTTWNDSRHCPHCLPSAQDLNLVSRLDTLGYTLLHPHEVGFGCAEFRILGACG